MLILLNLLEFIRFLHRFLNTYTKLQAVPMISGLISIPVHGQIHAPKIPKNNPCMINGIIGAMKLGLSGSGSSKNTRYAKTSTMNENNKK